MTLSDLIVQLADDGFTDPRQIAEVIMETESRNSVNRLVGPHLAEMIAWYAARLCHVSRRQSPAARARRDEADAAPRIRRDNWWVDGVGWVAREDLTEADCRAIAAHRARLAAGNLAAADRFLACADLIRSLGVATLGEAERVSGRREELVVA